MAPANTREIGFWVQHIEDTQFHGKKGWELHYLIAPAWCATHSILPIEKCDSFYWKHLDGLLHWIKASILWSSEKRFSILLRHILHISSHPYGLREEGNTIYYIMRIKTRLDFGNSHWLPQSTKINVFFFQNKIQMEHLSTKWPIAEFF